MLLISMSTAAKISGGFFMPTWLRSGEVLSCIVGVIVACILAMWHDRSIRKVYTEGRRHTEEARKLTEEARKLTEEARNHTENLKKVEEEMSTRYLGVFPQFLPNITRLAEGAKENIVIFCDFPAYGSFSAPAEYEKYRQAIKSTCAHVELRYLNRDLRQQYMRERITSDPSKWADWKEEPNHKENLRKLLQRYNLEDGDEAIEALGFEGFVALIDRNDKNALEDDFVHAHTKRIDVYTPIYCWIFDYDHENKNADAAAVFSLRSLRPGTYEHGFFTKDTVLIKALAEMRDAYSRQPETTPHDEGLLLLFLETSRRRIEFMLQA